MATPRSTECIGRTFLFNMKPRPIEAFSDDLLHSGRSIYEVIRIIGGKPLFLKEHIERLVHSSEMSGIPLSCQPMQVIEGIRMLVAANPFSEGNVKLLIRSSENSADFIVFFDCHVYPSQEDYKYGIKTGIHEAERTNPNVKTVNMPLRQETRERMKEDGYYEVFLVNRSGCLTEGSRSNLFFILGKQIITPPLSEVLPGITRRKIIEICRDIELPITESPVPKEDIGKYESAFITGTSPKVLPVRSIEEIGFWVDNPVIREIQTAYDNLIAEDIGSLQGWD